MTDFPARAECFSEKFLKKVAGRSEIDDALRRLDKLTQEEHRMATAQALRATHGVRLDGEHIKRELRQVVVHVYDQKCSSPHNSPLVGRGVSACFTGDQLRKGLATWLSPPDPFINYNTASDARYGATGVWITKMTEFKNWKESTSLLWVYGKRTFSRTLRTRSY